MNTLINIVKFPVFLICCVLYLASEMLLGLSILLDSIGEVLEDLIDE
jgi:hypothetical protein